MQFFFDIHKQKGGLYPQMSKKQYFNMERGPPETMGLMPGGQILYLLVCTSNSHKLTPHFQGQKSDF